MLVGYVAPHLLNNAMDKTMIVITELTRVF